MKAGAEITAQIKADIKDKKITRHGPVNASGDAAASIRFEVINGTTLIVYGADYIYYLQHGRKPGKRPPRKAIREWIDDKGIEPDGITKDQLAFLIQRKIGNSGTDIFMQGGSDLISATINQNLINDIRSKAITTFETFVLSEIRQAFKSDIVNLQA